MPPHPPLYSSDMPSERIATLVGKCILNFQRCELLLKKLTTSVEHVIVEPDERAKQIVHHSVSTLGSLVTAFQEKAFSYDGQDRKEDLSKPWSVRFEKVFPTETRYAAQRASLADMVKARNHLAHHFLEDHALQDNDSCIQAEQYLERLLERTREWLSDMRMFAGRMDQARVLLAKSLADPNVSCRLFETPPTDADEWHALDEIKALRSAEALKAEDGYTDLDAALEHLKSLGVAPDAFMQIGLNSWQHLIHESKCFDLTKEKDEISGRWVRRYKSR